MQAEQAAQAHLLQAYRARQQQRLHLEAEALRAKLLLQQQTFMGQGLSEGSCPPGDDASGDAAAAGEPRTRAWLRALRQHESQWVALEAGVGSSGSAEGTGGGMAYADVPWPPLECAEYLQALAALEHAAADQQAGAKRQPGHEGRGQQQEPRRRRQRAHRRAYARACLRWHPDKFVARWGRLLAEADSQRILQRVQQLSQGLNQAWEALQQEGRQGEEDEPTAASSAPP